ncbi:hypothetical protein [Azospirillum largimobile]
MALDYMSLFCLLHPRNQWLGLCGAAAADLHEFDRTFVGKWSQIKAGTKKRAEVSPRALFGTVA